MDDFQGKLAVITGAGSGIGRQLALQLVKAGAHVAICDLFEESLADTRTACEAAAASGVRVSAHVCDVSSEAQVLGFRDAALRAHGREHVELLFNNAGVGGGGSFIHDSRADWERTFNVCWYGVYFCSRAFLPLLIASPEACIINLSSINGVFALSPGASPQTAYSSAKFAVKGFSEALQTDLRVYAPHVSLVLVMPGHIGTAILANTLRSQGLPQPKDMSAAELGTIRGWMKRRNVPEAGLTDQQVREGGQAMVDEFRDKAPVSAAEAAAEILRAVREKRWRLLIGDDARFLDKLAREHPDELYRPEFLQRVRDQLPGGKRS